MTTIGYALSCDEHSPRDLVRYAQRAEQGGFEFALRPTTTTPGSPGRATALSSGACSRRSPGEEDVCRGVPCTPNREVHEKAIRRYEKAGYDHVYIHQMGPDRRLLPLRRARAAPPAEEDLDHDSLRQGAEAPVPQALLAQANQSRDGRHQ